MKGPKVGLVAIVAVLLAPAVLRPMLHGAQAAQAATPPTSQASPAPTPPPPTPPPPTPDRVAFNVANAVQDPQAKVDALEKVIASFPGTPSVLAANQALFDTVLKNWPSDTQRIAAQGQRVVDATPEANRSSAYGAIATRLLDAGVMLETAQLFAEKAIALIDEEAARTARTRRATPLATLGRIYLKAGKTAEAEKVLKESYAASPMAAGPAAAALAEMAEKSGNMQTALDYWVSAALSGRMTAKQRGQLEAAYSTTHSGSLDGLEALLDDTYHKAYPETFTPPPYMPRAARTKRTVLTEVFTGAGCPPCVSSSIASDYVRRRYSEEDVVVLMYHEHIPVPDPMTNPSTEAYAKYYAVAAAPTVAFDGVKTIQGGGNLREQARSYYDRMVTEIDRRLEVAADAEIALDVAIDGLFVNAKATVSNISSQASKLRLQIALVEDDLRYNGENTIRTHPMVVRNLAGPSLNGFELDKAKPSAEWRFDLVALSNGLKKYLDEFEKRPRATPYAFAQKKDIIDPAHLTVVAFVQDEVTKKVLQATSVKVRP